MSVEKMRLVRASGETEQLPAFLERLSLCKDIQPEDALGFLSSTLGYSHPTEDNPYEAFLQKTLELIKISGVNLKLESTSVGAVDDEMLDYVNKIHALIDERVKERGVMLEQISACKDGIERYTHFLGLDARLDELLKCSYIAMRFGRLPKESYERLQHVYGDNPYILFIECSKTETDYWGVYFAPRDKKDEIDTVFASLYFERLHIPEAVGTVDEIIKNLNENMAITEEQIKQFDLETQKELLTNIEKICRVYAYAKHKNELYELNKYSAVHGKRFYYVLWLPLSGVKFFNTAVNVDERIEIEISKPDADDKVKPPTKLKNSKLVRPFEYFVKMYGLPSYSDIDITAFVAVTYTVLFGIMFGDLGQGLVLALIGALMWKKKQMPLGKILIPCGISSMCFGLVFGSVFGYEELLDPLYHAVGLSGKPVSVMESINTVLIAAIAIGIGLVVTAILINIIASIKRRDFGEALFSNNGLAGLLLYICAVLAAVGFMAGKTIVKSSVLVPVIAVTAGLLFFKEPLSEALNTKKLPVIRRSEIADFLMQNVFEMLEYILSYFSNTVSFLRVGAFVLVHAGMMMVVFSLAGDSQNIFVIILGNILVIALEGLLVGIQALRLEFYEMFSRCFSGEGREFTPIGSTQLTKSGS